MLVISFFEVALWVRFFISIFMGLEFSIALMSFPPFFLLNLKSVVKLLVAILFTPYSSLEAYFQNSQSK